MRNDDDLSYSHPIDLVFEALARLAGTLEAQRALRRSAARHQQAREKKSRTPIDVRNDNTISLAVTQRNQGGSGHE